MANFDITQSQREMMEGWVLAALYAVLIVDIATESLDMIVELVGPQMPIATGTAAGLVAVAVFATVVIVSVGGGWYASQWHQEVFN